MRLSMYFHLTPKPFRKIYALFWVGLAGLLTILSYILLSWKNEQISPIMVLSFWSLMAIVPISHLDMSQDFSNVAKHLGEFFDLEEEKFLGWYKKQIDGIFSARNPVMWGVSILANVVCTVVVLYLGLPLKSTILNFLAMISFQVVVFFNGESIYALLAELLLLKQLVELTPRPHFYQSVPSAVRRLTTLYLKSATYILLVYLAVLITVATGPYGIPIVLMLVLVGIAVFPAVYILYIMSQLHKLMVKIKEGTLAIIDQKISEILKGDWINNDEKKVLGDIEIDRSEIDRVEYLSKLMDIRDRAEKMREWPWDLKSRVTFLISLLTGAVQVVAAVLDFI